MNFLTVPEVAKLVSACDETIYTAIRSGALRAAKPGRKLLVRPEAVDAWLEALADEKAAS